MNYQTNTVLGVFCSKQDSLIYSQALSYLSFFVANGAHVFTLQLRPSFKQLPWLIDSSMPKAVPIDVPSDKGSYVVVYLLTGV
ncbi:hypothetical protein GJ744_004583 [Endocarpon pusillum]|uniref:Uncharacterized protein n=1 Tax=Endocarpon pusillum TaxID=364733 RepID=A0A8H7ANG6_9EURO|nr:hypothetical protein GJ744_004583 [Endocarpon pusillum]